MPYVLGTDLVGEVLTIGTGKHSAKFNVGEYVFGHTMAEGGWDNDCNAVQQYALVDARFVDKVADSDLSDDEASTIPVVALAAFIALFARVMVCPLLFHRTQHPSTTAASHFW